MFQVIFKGMFLFTLLAPPPPTHHPSWPGPLPPYSCIVYYGGVNILQYLLLFSSKQNKQLEICYFFPKLATKKAYAGQTYRV